MNEMIIIEVKISDTLNLLCYEGDLNCYNENEDKLCHYFVIKFIEEKIAKKIKNCELTNYAMYINENKNTVEFTNDSDGDYMKFEYLELAEFHLDYEIIYKYKIKHLVETHNILWEDFKKKSKVLGDISAFFAKELVNIDKKIDFLKSKNGKENLFINIGRKEMAAKILKIMETNE